MWDNFEKRSTGIVVLQFHDNESWLGSAFQLIAKAFFFSVNAIDVIVPVKSLGTNSINLIDEDNTRGLLFR